MTIADFLAALTGWTATHAPKQTDDAPSAEEALAALADEMASGRVHHG